MRPSSFWLGVAYHSNGLRGANHIVRSVQGNWALFMGNVEKVVMDEMLKGGPRQERRNEGAVR